MPKQATQKNIAVVGAGPSGLVVIKELIKHGHQVTAFEKQSCLGGVYSLVQYDLCLTTNSVNVAFSTYYEYDIDKPKMWNKAEYMRYLQGYVDKYQLLQYIRFAHKVKSIKKLTSTNKWQLTACDLSQNNAAEQNHEFDHIVVCSGFNSEPNIPNFPGLDQFAGQVLHMVNYRKPEVYKDKNVLIIGLGESGSDISYQVAQHAKTSCISVGLAPGYFIPRYFGGSVTDLDTNRCYHALPRWLSETWPIKLKLKLENLYFSEEDDKQVLDFAGKLNQDIGLHAHRRFGTKNIAFARAVIHHNMLYKPNIKRIEKDRVIFEDDSEFKCDTIILCTGFKFCFPFLAKHHHDLGQRACIPRNLFKSMIIPEMGTDIAWIGLVRPGIGSIPPCSEMQARYYVQLISGQQQLPSIDAMQADIKKTCQLDHEQYPLDAANLPSLTDYFRFMTSMSHLIGCQPRLGKLFFTKPRIWAKVLFAPIVGAQFRLFGPDNDVKDAEALLKKLPTMPKPVIAYEFILFIGCKILSCLGFKSFKLMN